MKKLRIVSILLLAAILTGCGESEFSHVDHGPAETTAAAETESSTEAQTEDSSASETEAAAEESSLAVASGDDVIEQDAVGYEGMTPVTADQLADGAYTISVDSSSSMFKIASCELKVENGTLTAALTINSTSYEYLFAGTAEQAAQADASQYIMPASDEESVSVFTFPIEALDQEIDCAAFSRRKQLWYDRKLVFRADSLPDDAFTAPRSNSVEALGLADGEYTVDVTLEGGSGKASVQSPAKLTIENGEATAEIIWSSNKYDYMIVDQVKFLPVSTEENSVFEIPVEGFDAKLKVLADTTAMSTPHEIEYTLYFDSATIQ